MPVIIDEDSADKPLDKLLAISFMKYGFIFNYSKKLDWDIVIKQEIFMDKLEILEQYKKRLSRHSNDKPEDFAYETDGRRREGIGEEQEKDIARQNNSLDAMRGEVIMNDEEGFVRVQEEGYIIGNCIEANTNKWLELCYKYGEDNARLLILKTRKDDDSWGGDCCDHVVIYLPKIQKILDVANGSTKFMEYKAYLDRTCTVDIIGLSYSMFREICEATFHEGLEISKTKKQRQIWEILKNSMLFEFLMSKNMISALFVKTKQSIEKREWWQAEIKLPTISKKLTKGLSGTEEERSKEMNVRVEILSHEEICLLNKYMAAVNTEKGVDYDSKMNETFVPRFLMG